MNLAQTQRLFWEAITQPGFARKAELPGCFLETSALPAEARVGIYAEMVLFRQVDALREDFPQLAQQLGQHAFFHLAQDYVRAHPSESPDLGQLGRNLSLFLEGRPGLAELARLEWARAGLFYAPPAPPLGPSALSALTPEEFASARLQFVPALQLLELSYDVPTAWLFLREGASEVPIEPGRTFVAVWRKGFEVHHAALLPDEAQALQLALASSTLGEVCGAFVERKDPVAAAFETLASWLADEWLCGLQN